MSQKRLKLTDNLVYYNRLILQRNLRARKEGIELSEYILSCCSTADLSKEYLDSRDIRYVCFHYELDGKQYVDDLGQSMPISEFYRKMEEGSMTRTSQVNAEEYAAYFEQFLKAGKDVLHVCLSSGLSGTVNGANAAAAELREKYPERKIFIVDSLAASSGFGLLMDTLADHRDAGMSIEELRDWAEAHRLYLHHWFFSTDLKYYVRGGRISKTSGFIGGILGICPLLNVNDEGKLIPREKIRGKKRVIAEIVERMKEHAEGGSKYSGKCFISMSACENDAKAVAALVEEAFPKLNGKVHIFDIGTTIGSHTGPGTVALFFWGDKGGH